MKLSSAQVWWNPICPIGYPLPNNTLCGRRRRPARHLAAADGTNGAVVNRRAVSAYLPILVLTKPRIARQVCRIEVRTQMIARKYT